MPPVNNRIREVRERKGWSIARFGRECRPKVPPQTIQRHETGAAQVDLLQLETYAAALGVAPEELLARRMRISDRARELLEVFNRMPPAEQSRLIKLAAALIDPEPMRKAS